MTSGPIMAILSSQTLPSVSSKLPARISQHHARAENAVCAHLTSAGRTEGGLASASLAWPWSEVRKVTERLSLGTEYKLSYPDKDLGSVFGGGLQPKGIERLAVCFSASPLQESGLTMAYEYLFRPE